MIEVGSYASTRISASAGSGKTYQLVLRFISLMSLGVPAEQIIALTFTRKAAAEFTSRILERLADAASSDDKAGELARELYRTINGGSGQPALANVRGLEEASLDRLFFLGLLRSFTDRLGRISMSTLDSFFSRMLNVLKLDLGMTDISVANDEDLARAREEVLRLIYGSAVFDIGRKQDFLEVFRRATIGRETDNLDTGLRDFIAQFHEYYLNAWDPGQWGNTGLIWSSSPWWYDAPDHAAAHVLARAMTAGRLDTDLLPLDGKPPHSSIVNGLIKLRDSILQAHSVKWPKYMTRNFFDQLRSGTTEFTFSRRSYRLTGDWAAGLLALSKFAIKRAISHAFERTKGIHGLVDSFEELYDTRIRRQGRLVFSDVARLLLPPDKGGFDKPASFDEALTDLQFRMDGWYRHWMLDEFQDTSNVQWNIIAPLLDEVVQDAEASRSLFIVGDAKQSIYQWRGGSPRIFASLSDPGTVWGKTLVPWNMDASYRSAKPVLDMVNAVCDFKRTAAMAHQGARDRWDFHRHTPAGGAAQLDGYAEAILITADEVAEPEDSGTAEHREISEIIRKTDPLGRNLTCAVLVGTNDQAAAMKAWLASPAGGGIPCHIETDVPAGTDSLLGAALADFFQWLLHPADSFAWQHLKASAMGSWLTGDGSDAIWTAWRTLYEKEGVLAVVRKWERLLTNGKPALMTAYQRERLELWKTEAAAFDNAGGGLEEWGQTIRRIKKREHSRDDTVQIMTWHKSKGLEFDMVILPICTTRKFDDGSHFKVMKQEDRWGGTLNILLPPESSIIDKDPGLDKMKREWEEDQQFEGFCKLYVALTRAKRACHVLVGPARCDPTCCPSEIFHQAFAATNQGQDADGRVLASFGNPDWYRAIPLAGTLTGITESHAASAVSARVLPSSTPRPTQTPSALGHAVLEPSSPDLCRSREQARLTGIDVHRIFRQILWWDDDRNIIPAGISPEAADIFLRAIGKEAVAQWLRQPEGEAVTVWREKPVHGIWGGHYISGIVDRTHLQDGCLTIIDFKTDRADTIDELADRHRAQLECYRDLLCSALKVSADNARCVIVSTHLADSIVF